MKRKWLRDRTRRDQGGLDFVMAHIQVRVSSPSLLTVYGTSRLRSCSAASCAALVLSYAKGKGRAETWSHDVTRMSDAVRPAASDARDIWEVVGGAGHGGIVVRRGRDLGSTLLHSRLGQGSVVQQVSLIHGRLRYVKISGEGPDHGWVSLRSGGKQLLRHVDVVSSTKLHTRSFGSPGLILCIGDSLTAGGYPTLLQGLLSDASPAVVKDFGVRGASVLPMAGGPCVAYSSLARLDAELRCNPPDAIIVMLGTNDARSAHWDAEAFQMEYCALLQRLEGLELEPDAVGSRRLVLIAVPPRVTPNAWGIDVDIADNDLANAVEVVAQKMGMALVNLRDVLDPIAAFVSDGVHLTQAGSALVAENAKRALLPAICCELGGAFQRFELLRRKQLTPTACLLRFAVPGGQPLGGYDRTAPTGVKVQLLSHDGSSLEKSYSPVSHPSQVGFFDLLVRAYPPRPGGGLGAHLCGLRPGQAALMKVKPESFSSLCGAALRPGRWDRLGLIAAGTGLAPLLQVAREALSWRDTTRLSLVLACRSESEILMREELELLAQNPAIRISYQLSKPGPGWPSDCSGRLSKAVLEQSLPSPDSRGRGSGTATGSKATSPEKAQLAALLKLRSYVTVGTVEKAISPVLKKWHAQPAMATHVLTRLRQARRALTAWQVLQVMRSSGIETNVIHYSSVIIACENQGAWQLALDLVGSMVLSRIEHDVISMSSAISACEKVGQWERALALLETMKKQRIWPNVVSYSAAISACEKKGEWQQAVQLLEAMHEHRVSPNDITCNSAISSCELQGQWLVAVDLLNMMPAIGVSPDVISFNSALSSCEETGFWQLALNLLSGMQHAQLAPNIRTCNSVMNTLQADGQWQRAWSLLSLMRLKVIIPDVTTCSRAIDCCERGSRWQLVAALVCSMQEVNLEKTLRSMYADRLRFLSRQSLRIKPVCLCFVALGLHNCCLILVCGTDGFVESMAGPVERVKTPDGQKRKQQGKLGGLLAELGYTSSQVHKF
ncbi:unnamed protein product [Symbiodinium sp. KB8]|nr:unnamed protein product [Symbiodinium sp. KB8]